jgi:hypothetical protein
MWDETPPAPIEIHCPFCDDDEIIYLPDDKLRCETCGETFEYWDDWWDLET